MAKAVGTSAFCFCCHDYLMLLLLLLMYELQMAGVNKDERSKQQAWVKHTTAHPLITVPTYPHVSLLLPQVAGVNFEEMVEAAMGDKLDLTKPLLDYESGNDAITVFLE
jgi:hypothetical protein